MSLNPWDSEAELIRMILATGLLKGDDTLPQSLLLVSPWGQGKSAMITRFRAIGSTSLLSDITSMGMRRLIDKDSRQVVRHWLLPEFERLFTRDMKVASQAIALLSNLMTGDAGLELIGNMEHDFTGKQIGIIGAMTTDVFKRREDEMRQTGLLSRFTVIRVDRSEDERRRVLENMYRGDKHDLRLIEPWRQEAREVVYCGSPELAGALAEWVRTYPAHLEHERSVARYITFMRAIAWLCGDSTVTLRHFHILRRFTPFFLGANDVRLGEFR